MPVVLFDRLFCEVSRGLENSLEESSRWLGHRVWLIDGSSCSMPDTPELREAFGQPGQQARGCGFPVAHLLTLFHAGTGLLLRAAAAPLCTHDMAQAQLTHGELAAGDVLLGDRGFCSYCAFGPVNSGSPAGRVPAAPKATRQFSHRPDARAAPTVSQAAGQCPWLASLALAALAGPLRSTG